MVAVIDFRNTFKQNYLQYTFWTINVSLLFICSVVACYGIISGNQGW